MNTSGQEAALEMAFLTASVRLTPTSEHNAVQRDNAGQDAALGMAGPKQAVTTGPTALFQPELKSGAQWVDPMAITSPSLRALTAAL